MKRPRYSPGSRNDLRDILEYIAARNPLAAKKVIADIKSTCRQLARFPEIGALREELAPNLRCFPVGNYVVFYVPAARTIEVVRIVHGSRDFGGLFPSTS
jgi:toxin ParE1/3/4